MDLVTTLFNDAFVLLNSIPEKDKFLTIMLIPAVLSTGFLIYEIATKGFGNGTCTRNKE